jgi:hypothetical protein
MPVKVQAPDTGGFELNGKNYAFTLTAAGSGFKLASEGAEYRLERQGAAGPAPPVAATSNDSIVGSWRNATGSAQFNADGTGVVDGTPGRYEIRGNQLTLIGAQGQVTAAVRGARRRADVDRERRGGCA